MNYLHHQLTKARHDDLLQDAAQRRLAAQARQTQPRWRRRPAPGGPGGWLACARAKSFT